MADMIIKIIDIMGVATNLTLIMVGVYVTYAYIFHYYKRNRHKLWYCDKCNFKMQKAESELSAAKEEIERLRIQLHK